MSPAAISWNDIYACNEVTSAVRLNFARRGIKLVRRRHASESNPPTTFTRRVVSVIGTTAVLSEIRKVRAVKEYGHTVSGVFVDRIRWAKASWQGLFSPANVQINPAATSGLPSGTT